MDMNLIIESLKKASRNINALPFNKVSLWINAMKCFLLYGATPSDWNFYEMYKYNHRENKEIITSRKSNKLDRLFNPREYKDDFDNKVMFNTKYSKFVKRQWLYTMDKSKEEIEAFVEQLNEIVVKPIGLSSGWGIYLTKIESEADVKKIASEFYGKEYLLEEKIELVPELKNLNPSSCQTLRIITMITRSGEVEVLAAAIRVGGGNEILDNFHAKGIAYPIDVREGIISGIGKDLNNKYHLRHPSTNILMPGFQIPCWGG